MLEFLFYLLLLLCLYPYLFYPLAVSIWAGTTGRRWRSGGCRPRVSIIISVYNEEAIIREKLENTLQLTYPHDLLEVLVVSDGSTDRTNETASSFADSRLRLRAFAGRRGKTACLNLAVPEATGEIVLFTDANSMFPPDLLVKLAENFADETIGLVTGWTKYGKPGETGETVGLYGRLEMMTKRAESLISSCVGADGAVFAIRKSLFLPLDEGDINDFVIPLQVVSQGKRVVLDPDVYCFEQPGGSEKNEYGRQVRITNRTLTAIGRNSHFLNPFVYGSFSFFLFSHKVLRFLVPFTFLGLFAAALLLADRSLLPGCIAAGQLLFVAVGIGGLLNILPGRPARLCAFFLLTITAQFSGWLRWSSGKTDIIWKSAR